MSHQPPANGDMPAKAGDDSESVLRPIYPVERESEDDVLEPAEEERRRAIWNKKSAKDARSKVAFTTRD